MNTLEMMITIDVRQIHLRSKAAEAVLDIPNGTPYIQDVESGTLSTSWRGRCKGGEGPATCMKELEMNTAPVPVDPTLFKAYDVRGIAGENLTDEVAYGIGRAVALYLNVPEIAVGRDMRLSSPQLAAALFRGIIDQGTNAIDLGMVTTDGLYFAVGAFDYSAGGMITASHNPGQYNGMKFCRARAFPISLDSGLAAIRDLAVRGDFPTPVHAGQVTKHNIIDAYVRHT